MEPLKRALRHLPAVLGLCLLVGAVYVVWQEFRHLKVADIKVALQAIPRESYEASETDGASRWQQFKWITLPGLKAATAFLVVYGLLFLANLGYLALALPKWFHDVRALDPERALTKES